MLLLRLLLLLLLLLLLRLLLRLLRPRLVVEAALIPKGVVLLDPSVPVGSRGGGRSVEERRKRAGVRAEVFI